jgi:leucyl aminopeptidase (aminopeptidase T)
MNIPSYNEAKSRDMAKLVLGRTLRIQAGETVTIETWDNTLPWANDFVLEARRLGATPLLLHNDEATFWKSLEVAGGKKLGAVGRHEWALLEKTNAYVNFYGPSDVQREHAMAEATRSDAYGWEDRWFETANRAGVRMARMYLGRAGPESAKIFDIDVDEWRRELVDATLVDPVGMHRTGTKLAERLKKGKVLEILHPNGTALRLGLRHRAPRVDSGILPIRPNGTKRVPGHPGLLDINLPAGVVTVAVDEASGDGTFIANEPSTDVPTGRASGGRWEFRQGKLVDYKYAVGGDGFEKVLREAGPHLSIPAAVSIGLNPKIRHAPWMHDQKLGNVSFIIGGNRYWGGETEGHGFHPFLILSDAEVRVDGRPIVKPVT